MAKKRKMAHQPEGSESTALGAMKKEEKEASMPGVGLPDKVVIGNSSNDPGEPQVECCVRAKSPGEALNKAQVILRQRHIDREGREKSAIKRFYDEKRRRAETFATLRPIIPAGKILKQGRRRWKDEARLRRCDRLIGYGRGSVSHEETHRVLFVFRNTSKGMCKASNRLLTDLGIKQTYTGVFMPNTPLTMELLYRVLPHVIYGYPTFNTVQKMFQKIGRLKLRQSTFTVPDGDESDDSDDGRDGGTGRKPPPRRTGPHLTPTTALLDIQMKTQLNEEDLNDNRSVEERLGKYGVLCVDDLINEIWTNGKYFAEVSDELAPFRIAHLMKSDGVETRPLESGNLNMFLNKRLTRVV